MIPFSHCLCEKFHAEFQMSNISPSLFLLLVAKVTDESIVAMTYPAPQILPVCLILGNSVSVLEQEMKKNRARSWTAGI